MLRPRVSFVDLNESFSVGRKNWQAHKCSRRSCARGEIIHWLTPDDPRGLQNRLRSKRLELTGKWYRAMLMDRELWLFNLKEFQAWTQGRGQALCCIGPSGGGKMYLASLVIHHIRSLEAEANHPLVAYIYCKSWGEVPDNMENFMAILLKQLIRVDGSVPTQLEKLFARFKRLCIRPTWEELFQVLQGLLSAHGKSFIIVGGLNECRDDEVRNSLLQVLEHCRERSRANILFTSTSTRKISDHFEGHGYSEVKGGGRSCPWWTAWYSSWPPAITLWNVSDFCSTST
jgi:preprotein translocase subunit Sss1